MAEQQFEGRSVAEAAIKACEKLGLTRQDLVYKVVSETGEAMSRKVVIAVSIDAALAPKTTTQPEYTAEQRGQAEETPRRSNASSRRSQAPRYDAERSPARAHHPKSRDSANDRTGDRSGERERSESAPRRKNYPRHQDNRSEGREQCPQNQQRPRNDGIDALLRLDEVQMPAPRPSIQPQTEKAKQAQAIIRRLIELMALQIKPRLLHEGEEEIHFDLSGEDSQRLIGKKGEILQALQFLTNRILSRSDNESDQLIFLDADSYRERRRQALENLAKTLAQRSLEEGKAVRLSPMSAHDRRIFHIALKDLDGITTRSEGEGLYRNLLIVPSPF